MKYLHHYIAVLLFVLFSNVFGLSDAEMDTMKSRVVEMEKLPTLLLQKSKEASVFGYPVDVTPPVSKNDLARISKSIQPDGTFKDVNYKDKNRSAWLMLKHLDYCRMLAIALHTYPEHILKQYKVRENCMKALDWWLDHKPRNPNWWCNDVYVPQMLGNISLLLGEEALTPARTRTIQEMTKSVKPRKTGQNLMWLSWNSLLLGLMVNDSDRVEQAMDSLNDTIKISVPGKEGIQLDMSFHQHGPQLYQGNYGRHYLHSAAKFLNIARDTRWSSKDKTKILEHYMLDGTRWMCWGKLLDYSVWGRQITYPDRFQGPDIVYACNYLLPCADSRKDEVASFASSLLTDGNTSRLTGTRAFPMSDYIVHRTLDFMATVRMSSNRTIIGEITNGDNLKGAYLSDGAMLVYKTGKEYDSIFPCWDWTRIPGTTSRQDYLPGKWAGQHGGSPFAGSMNQGAAGMTADHFGLKANKSWFFFDDRIICLGSGITSKEMPDHAGPVVTTIEQCLFSGEAPVRLKGEKAAGIVHNGSLYLISNKNKPSFETAKRKGSWKSIRSSSTDEMIEKPVFLLTIDHGRQPDNGAYAYQVFPKKPNVQSVDSLWNETRIIRHDEKIHAVEHKGQIKAVFFTPEELTLPDGSTIRPSEPCLLSISPKDGLKIQIPGKTEGKTTLLKNGKPVEIKIENVRR